MQKQSRDISPLFYSSHGAFCCRKNRKLHLKVLEWPIPLKFSLSLCRLEPGLAVRWGGSNRDLKYSPALKKHGQFIVSKGELTPLWIKVKCVHKKPAEERGFLSLPEGYAKSFLEERRGSSFLSGLSHRDVKGVWGFPNHQLNAARTSRS